MNGVFKKIEPGEEKKYIALENISVKESDENNVKVTGKILIGNTFFIEKRGNKKIKVYSNNKSGYIDVNSLFISLSTDSMKMTQTTLFNILTEPEKVNFKPQKKLEPVKVKLTLPKEDSLNN